MVQNMEDEPPRSPGEPREGEPYYIDSECPECGSELILYDSLSEDQVGDSSDLSVSDAENKDEVWHDEWCCPNCLDGIFLDVPDQVFDQLEHRLNTEEENGETISVDELTEELAEATGTTPEEIKNGSESVEIESLEDSETEN
jgi:rubredoxin